ncbi:MAG: hypothetical protein IKR63_07560 [Alloprevotella sp.]|nr:hypothetical protein [Alloprevotella sp.]
MRQYFTNLMTALCGVNPFEAELERVRQDYNRVAEQVAQLQSVYDSVKKMTTTTAKQNKSLQRLVENLRTRISEKDTLIEQMKVEYKKLVKKYNVKTDELQNVEN